MWKRKLRSWIDIIQGSFSPLAGIRYVETRIPSAIRAKMANCFSPLAGIRYVETTKVPLTADVPVVFQSPCGD